MYLYIFSNVLVISYRILFCLIQLYYYVGIFNIIDFFYIYFVKKCMYNVCNLFNCKVANFNKLLNFEFELLYGSSQRYLNTMHMMPTLILSDLWRVIHYVTL